MEVVTPLYTGDVDVAIAEYEHWKNKCLTEEAATQLFLELVFRTKHNPQPMGFYSSIKGLDRDITYISQHGTKGYTNIQVIALSLLQYQVITETLDRRYQRGPNFDLRFTLPRSIW